MIIAVWDINWLQSGAPLQCCPDVALSIPAIKEILKPFFEASEEISENVLGIVSFIKAAYRYTGGG